MLLRLQDRDQNDWFVSRAGTEGKLTIRFTAPQEAKIPVKIYAWGGGDTPRDALLQVRQDGVVFHHPTDPSFVFNDVVAAFEIDDEILRIGTLAKSINCMVSWMTDNTMRSAVGISLSLAELILDNLTAWKELKWSKGVRVYLERDKATGLYWLYGAEPLFATTNTLPTRLPVWPDNDPTWTFSSEHIDLYVYDSADRENDLFRELSINLDVLLGRV